MGIRDTSYYGWQNDERVEFLSASVTAVTADVSGAIYACGYYKQTRFGTENAGAFVKHKTASGWETILEVTGNAAFLNMISNSRGGLFVIGSSLHQSTDYGATWSSIPTTAMTITYLDATSDGMPQASQGICVDSAGVVYFSRGANVASSSADYSSWGVRTVGNVGDDQFATSDMAADSNDIIYYAGDEDSGAASVEKTVNGGETWADATPAAGLVRPTAIGVDSNNNVYVHDHGSGVTPDYSFSSSDAGANWGQAEFKNHGLGGGQGYISSSVVQSYGSDSQGNMYAAGWHFSQSSPGLGPVVDKEWYVVKKTTFGPEWVNVDYLTTSSFAKALGVCVAPSDEIYTCGYIDAKFGTIRKGKLTANSASIGPTMLNTSFGYVHSETTGTLNQIDERFKLNNVSEFPHGGGIWQMKNLVLGTVSSGKIGNREDSIIQVNHIGSVVNVVWPKQGDHTDAVRGYGDLAAGQRAGKLTTQFEPGDFFDTTKYDHMTLYCSLLKNLSGTLDNVEIKIERRPIRSAPSSVDQAVEYETSGSVTIAKLTDIIYKKEIDYGNLDIKEISYPVDIPLVNVKEVRVLARHSNGQSEDNKNLIIWGRFIDSDLET